jgi:hypothetical protein
MAIGPAPLLTPDSIKATAEAAAKAVIPPFATMSPKPEAGSPVLGITDAITRPDHQHPRLTATAKGTLDTNGLATVVFTQVFDTEPAISLISIGARTQGTAIPDFDFTFTTDSNGKFIGGTVYGRRARKLPSQPLAGAPMSVLAVLGTVVTGLNTLANSISGYDTTENAAGNQFSLIAVKAS